MKQRNKDRIWNRKPNKWKSTHFKENTRHLPQDEDWNCNSKEHTLFQEKLIKSKKERILQAHRWRKRRRRRRGGEEEERGRWGGEEEERGKSHFYFKGEILGCPTLFLRTVKLPNDNGEMPPKFWAKESVMQEYFTQPSCIQA